MYVVVVVATHRAAIRHNDDTTMFVRHTRSLGRARRTLEKQALASRARPLVVRHAFFLQIKYQSSEKSKQASCTFLQMKFC
jgi:hypothetical protein